MTAKYEQKNTLKQFMKYCQERLLYVIYNVNGVICTCYSNSEDVEGNLMVNDAYDILAVVSATSEGRTAMCAKHTVSALCQAVANHCCCMSTITFSCVFLCILQANCLVLLLLRNIICCSVVTKWFRFFCIY